MCVCWLRKCYQSYICYDSEDRRALKKEEIDQILLFFVFSRKEKHALIHEIYACKE